MSDFVSFDVVAGEQFLTDLQRPYSSFKQSARIEELESDLSQYLNAETLTLRRYITEVEADAFFVARVVESFGGAPAILATSILGYQNQGTALAAQLAELNARIQNWQGSDNDPLLDHMLRERREIEDQLRALQAAQFETTGVDVFSEEYMSEFVGTKVPVADEARLNEIMETLLLGDPVPGERDALIIEMATLRGYEDPADFQAQYAIYELLAQDGEEFAQKTPDDIDMTEHPDFLGSVVSLRYGQVVGDVLDIDPVLGAMLNPSGGLVGPGNEAYMPGENDALGYHGTFHDAAGYLYTYHGIGPGYDYLEREALLLSKDDPNAGQFTGISWWVTNNPLLDVDASDVAIIAGQSDNTFVDGGVRVLSQLGFEEAVGQLLLERETNVRIENGISDIVQGDLSGFVDIADAKYDHTLGTADNIWDFGVKSFETSVIVGEATATATEYVAGEVVDAGQYVGDRAVDAGQYVGDRAVDAGGFVAGEVVNAGEEIVDSWNGLKGWLG